MGGILRVGRLGAGSNEVVDVVLAPPLGGGEVVDVLGVGGAEDVGVDVEVDVDAWWVAAASIVTSGSEAKGACD